MSQVNDNANEAIGVGTQVTGIDSSSEGYVTNNLYLNNSTWDLWKCTGTDTWELQGNIEGATGQDGTDGTNGTNSYIWVRYSESADGTGFDATPTPAKKYMGVYAGTSSTAPTDKTAYTWVKYIGEDGVSGKDGNLNYYGTLITGNSTTPTVYATGIEYANIGDSYTNTTTFFEYRCVLAGEEVVAKWVYVGSKKGADGLGSGDMTKATYDVNNNGIVDNAEKLGGKLPSHYLYSLPIGGTSLGGVKNGGNVTINEDGEMNAEVGAGTWSALNEKPFSTVGSDFLKVTPEGVLDGDSTKLATLNVASADRLKKIVVTGVGAGNANKWTKVGSFTSSGSNKGYSAILAVTDKVYNTNTFFMSINFRTGNTSSAADAVSLGIKSVGDNGAAHPSRDAAPSFKLVYTAPLFELWFNPLSTYLSPVITIVNETTLDANLMTYYSNQPYQDTAPTGTVLTCTPLPVTADQLTTASTTVKGCIKIGNGLTIASEVARLDKYTFTDTTIATTDFATYTPSGTVETDLATAGYDYKAHIASTGVTADHEANVVFGAIEADSGNYASIAITEAGYVNIYAKEVPSSAITIPTIDCMYKGV